MKYIFSIAVLLMLTACTSLPEPVMYEQRSTATGSDVVYIVNHGWHTGIVLPAHKVFAELPRLGQRFNNAEYIEFGWGDKGFYQAKEITTALTLQAIFWPTESVMHAVAIPNNVKGYFKNSEVEALCLNDDAMEAMIKFVASSFARDRQGNVITLKSGIYGDSQFYTGVGRYYLMNTCNKWTAKSLKSMGMDISPVFKLTAASVMDFIREHKTRLTTHSTQQPDQCPAS